MSMKVSCAFSTMRLLVPFLSLLTVLAQSNEAPAAQHPVQDAFARELARCSPPAKPDDAAARDKAAELLRDSAILKDAAREMILWGGRPAGGSYRPDTYHLTEFNWMIFSSLYVSLFTFPGEYKVVEKDGFTILSMACSFRGELDVGAYPYPFWHKPGKWSAYEASKTVDFVFENDKVVAAFRVNEPDSKPKRELKWDGNWLWRDAKGRDMPNAALYDYLLSKENPNKKELESAYREFATEARKHNCMACHAPDNSSNMSKLSLLNYPNQALSYRHQIIAELDENSMPPKTKDQPKGIPDAEQRIRLLMLAKTFSEIGDKAIKFEEDRIKK
jgi:hypothetical protein